CGPVCLQRSVKNVVIKMDEDRMWKDVYERIVDEQEKRKRGEHQLHDWQISHEARLQEEDGGFFEKLGVRLAEKAQQQTQQESLTDEIVPICDSNLENGNVEEVCVVAEKRGALFAEKETALRNQINSGLDNEEDQKIQAGGDSSGSDSESHEAAIDFVAQSVGLNIEELYTAVLFITQHNIGSNLSEDVEQDAILSYLQKAFNIDNGTHEKILQETRQMEAPEMLVNIEVMEAKELLPKDSNGLSDPFCLLYLESAPTKRYNTAVKTETLTPVWLEHFEMPIADPENDILVVEVWDFDAAESVPEKMGKVKNVKGFKGMVKLAKEIAITATNGNHNNEFIGGIRVPLKEIPAAGQLKWHSLDKRNCKVAKHRGLIKLRLGFSAEHNAQVALQEHRHLVRILLLHELETKYANDQNNSKYEWNEDSWSPAAKLVLQQHGVQRGLSPYILALARFVEIAAIQREHQLSFEALQLLVEKIVEGMKEDEKLRENQEFCDLFWQSTKKALHSALGTLRKIRRLPADKDSTLKQILAIIRIVSSLSSLEIPEEVDLFPAKLYPWFPQEILDDNKVSVLQAMEFAVIRGAAEWFDYILSNNNSGNDSDEAALRYHIKVIQLIRLDLQRAMELHEKLFIKTINFPYTKTIYVTYEKRVSDLCMVIVEDICGRLGKIKIGSSEDPELNLGTTLFELYLAVQRFAAVGQNFCPEDLEDQRVQRYYDWFRAGVAHWLEIAVYKALKRIERAVEFDNLQPVDTSVQYSSSAVDTLTIFYQIKVFWTQLAWPDAEGAYAFIAKIVDDICKCCTYYVDKMSERAEREQEIENMKSPNNVYGRQFDVSVAWCYAINNIDHVRTSIEPLTKDLGFEEVLETLADTKSQQEAERCRQTLQLIVDNAKDTVRNRIVQMLEFVANKMAPAMSRYLMEGAELSDSTSNAMDRLMEYLDSNLVTLHDNLNEDNFRRILMVIWEMMADILHKLVNDNLGKRRPPSYYANLHKTLQTLIQFFNLGADDLANIKVLENIEKALKLYGLETNDLIHQFYIDRLAEQNSIDNEPYGQLTVKAYFLNDMLYVQILNARNLRSPDGGKCDTYVRIRIFPEEAFTGQKNHKTGVQKDTQFPLYEESFSIPLTPEQRKLDKAIIMFEMKDKDFLRTKFMAECFLMFSEIQEAESYQGFAQLPQKHLKLSRPTTQSSEAIHVLSRRKGDNLASDFVSKMQSKMNENSSLASNLVSKIQFKMSSS
ncbi:hypothetical protein QAD02_018125, partial [Eretmocerus hayati]